MIKGREVNVVVGLSSVLSVVEHSIDERIDRKMMDSVPVRN